MSRERSPHAPSRHVMIAHAKFVACSLVGLALSACGSSGGSDASTTSAIGIPSIDGLGPRGSGFHTKDELIEVASLVPKAEALAAFIAGRVAPGENALANRAEPT